MSVIGKVVTGVTVLGVGVWIAVAAQQPADATDGILPLPLTVPTPITPPEPPAPVSTTAPYAPTVKPVSPQDVPEPAADDPAQHLSTPPVAPAP